jgi:hypothetical protein
LFGFNKSTASDNNRPAVPYASDEIVFEQLVWCRPNDQGAKVELKTGISYDGGMRMFTPFVIFEINGNTHRKRIDAYWRDRDQAMAVAVANGHRLLNALKG